MIKKDIVIAVIATFCLTATLLTILPVGSLGEYNPWLDSFTGDGKIDARDVSPVSAAYGATGDPTKPVVIANFSTYEWWTWQSIGPYGIWDIYNSSRGYHQVTIMAMLQTNSHVTLEVCFEIGGMRGPWDVTSFFNAPGGENRITKTYNVIGSTIWIAIVSNEPSQSVGCYLGVYMTT
jgi:hypothetical protein